MKQVVDQPNGHGSVIYEIGVVESTGILLLFRATRATAIHNKLNREGKQGDCSQI